MSVQPRPSIHDQEENDYIYDDSLVTESGESQFEEDDQMYDSENEGNLSVNLRRDKFEMSRSVPRTPPRPKPPKYQPSPTPRYTPESYRRKPMEDSRSQSTCSSPPLIFILAIVIGLFSAGYFVYANRTTKPLLECSYEKLQIQYPEQSDNVWRTLRAGAEVILNKIKTEPAVYLFVHNDNSSERVLNMVKNIALHTSNCFGKDKQPVEMVKGDFKSSEAQADYGYVIKKYKEKIKKGNVILVVNLNDIPAEVSKAFHVICDTHNPIAENVIIFLTLTIPDDDEKGNVDSIAEDTLFKLWGSKLKHYELDPLIARVAEQVIALN